MERPRLITITVLACATAPDSLRELFYEPNDMFTILNLVSAGIGVSLVPRAARAMHVTGVKFAPIHSSYAEWDIGMAWNKKLESEIIRKFANVLSV